MTQVILEFEQIIGNVEGSQDGQAIEGYGRAGICDSADSLVDVRCQLLHVVGFHYAGRKPKLLPEYLDFNVLCHIEPPSCVRILARLASLRGIFKLLDNLEQLLKLLVHDKPLLLQVLHNCT